MFPFTATHMPAAAGPPAAAAAAAPSTAHPYAAGVGGRTFTLLTEWEDLALAVRCVWEPPTSGHAALATSQPPRELLSLCCAARAPPPVASVDDFFAALRSAFDRHRAAVLVVIRRGRVVLFQPFANDRAWRSAAFRPWVERETREGGAAPHPESAFEREAAAVGRYAAAKAAACGQAAEAMIPDPSRWWLNGHVVCNVRPANVWGDYQLREYLDMMRHAAALQPTLELDVLLNRRDAPLLVRPAPPHRPGLQVLSAYTSERAGDLPMPLADDWAAAAVPAVPAVPARAPAFPLPHSRPDARAVFRGSSTGRGVTAEDNLRLRLCLWACREAPELFDCRITRVNTRDQLAAGGRVVHPCARAIEAELRAAGAWAAPVPLEEQARRYRAAVYVRGHQAASRLGALFRLGFLVLALHPEGEAFDAPGWRPWFWPRLRPYNGWRDAPSPAALPLPAADEVFCVCASLPQLLRCAALLAARPDVSATIAMQGARRVGIELLGDRGALAREAATALCAAALRTYPEPPSHHTHPLFGASNFESVVKRSTRLG